MTADAIFRSRPRARDGTRADLRDIPDDGHRYETVDGSPYASPSPRRPRQIAAGRLEGAGMPSVSVHDVAGTAYRAAPAAGPAAMVDVPVRMEWRPAEPAGPRRRV